MILHLSALIKNGDYDITLETIFRPHNIKREGTFAGKEHKTLKCSPRDWISGGTAELGPYNWP